MGHPDTTAAPPSGKDHKNSDSHLGAADFRTMRATVLLSRRMVARPSTVGAARHTSVLATGRGTFGALGLGDYEDVHSGRTERVEYPLAEGSHVAKVATGWCVRVLRTHFVAPCRCCGAAA